MNDPNVESISPFETESELWQASLKFLHDLRKFRGQGFTLPDHKAAENLIKQFCSKLRKCPRWLSLPKIQKVYHLRDSAIIVVCQVLGSHWHMPRMLSSLQQVGILAYGFDPPALERYRWDVYREGPIGKFLRVEQRHQYTILHPSEFLLGLIDRSSIPLDFNEVIRSLPTASDPRKFPDSGEFS